MTKKFSLLMLAIIILFAQLCFAKELNTNSDKLGNVFGIDSSKQQHKNGLSIDKNNIYENPSRKRTQRLNKVINEKFDNYEKISTENKKQNTSITDYERSLFKKTDNLILKKQYNEAIIVLNEIITLRPNDEIALYNF